MLEPLGAGPKKRRQAHDFNAILNLPAAFLAGLRQIARHLRKRPDGLAQSPIAEIIWSMVRDGSAQPASPTILAGTPATVTLCGTGFTTTEPAAMRAQ
jgi:hypothetical protein